MDKGYKGLHRENHPRLTLDFDDSVQSNKGHIEGTAVGFNKGKKGSRSYYPLFCTVAQTGQFFDLHHRPGNVHDSNGTDKFMLDCLTEVRSYFKFVALESRMDSAFFSLDFSLYFTSTAIRFSVKSSSSSESPTVLRNAASMCHIFVNA